MAAVRGIRAAAAAVVALCTLPALVVPGRADASPMPVTSRFVAAGPVRVADTRPGQAPAGDGLEGVVAPGGVARVQAFEMAMSPTAASCAAAGRTKAAEISAAAAARVRMLMNVSGCFECDMFSGA